VPGGRDLRQTFSHLRVNSEIEDDGVGSLACMKLGRGFVFCSFLGDFRLHFVGRSVVNNFARRDRRRGGVGLPALDTGMPNR
jgi:hypothetical protein